MNTRFNAELQRRTSKKASELRSAFRSEIQSALFALSMGDIDSVHTRMKVAYEELHKLTYHLKEGAVD